MLDGPVGVFHLMIELECDRGEAEAGDDLRVQCIL